MIDLFYAIPRLLKRDFNNIFVFFCKFNNHHFCIIGFQQLCCSFLHFSSSSLLYIQVKAAFQRFDRNGDDRLNYREFCHMIHMRWQKIWWIWKFEINNDSHEVAQEDDEFGNLKFSMIHMRKNYEFQNLRFRMIHKIIIWKSLVSQLLCFTFGEGWVVYDLGWER